MNDNKKHSMEIALMLGGKPPMPGHSDASDAMEGDDGVDKDAALHDAMEHFLEAVEQKDVDGMVHAFESACEICDAEEDEQESEPDDGSDGSDGSDETNTEDESDGEDGK